MNLQKMFVLSALASSLSIPGATSAADLSVNGHIRADGACSIALGNGGVVDLGNVSRNDLPNAGKYYSYIERDMPLTINCQHPTKVGVEVIDNRDGTQPPGTRALGLGNPAVGFYTIRGSLTVGVAEVDGKHANTIWRSKDGSTWDGKTGYYGGWYPGYTTSWDVDGPQREPVAFKTLSDTLQVVAAFRPDIAFTDELAIDGSVTLELRYL
ncbi:DUF1120 domain-containing protein [Burkholderia sp. Ac-20353]|uniref:DUF1120 domain-containing protein n=1 Tax=Burkholderia sp. Ac-20353 TaxID=2703894 RepID=UPI00197C021A|nr:DUF1120 domain-containing protein [Burkholderia sp. Ac-20353]MBN3788035.1 DUF1120 domain-containing protein [Burkholderia sp. Ac-20353]